VVVLKQIRPNRRWAASFIVSISSEVLAVRVGGRSHRLEVLAVNVAPSPFFFGLEGAYDGVLGRVEVPGGMPVGRVVTTADVPALSAYPQMNPLRSNLEAIFTPQGAWLHISHMLRAQVLIQSFVLHNIDLPFVATLYAHLFATAANVGTEGYLVSFPA